MFKEQIEPKCMFSSGHRSATAQLTKRNSRRTSPVRFTTTQEKKLSGERMILKFAGVCKSLKSYGGGFNCDHKSLGSAAQLFTVQRHTCVQFSQKQKPSTRWCSLPTSFSEERTAVYSAQNSMESQKTCLVFSILFNKIALEGCLKFKVHFDSKIWRY